VDSIPDPAIKEREVSPVRSPSPKKNSPTKTRPVVGGVSLDLKHRRMISQLKKEIAKIPREAETQNYLINKTESTIANDITEQLLRQQEQEMKKLDAEISNHL
jgi:hypothetical protein